MKTRDPSLDPSFVLRALVATSLPAIVVPIAKRSFSRRIGTIARSVSVSLGPLAGSISGFNRTFARTFSGLGGALASPLSLLGRALLIADSSVDGAKPGAVEVAIPSPCAGANLGRVAARVLPRPLRVGSRASGGLARPRRDLRVVWTAAVVPSAVGRISLATVALDDALSLRDRRDYRQGGNEEQCSGTHRPSVVGWTRDGPCSV